MSESGLKPYIEEARAIVQMPPPQKKKITEVLGNGELLFSIYSQSVGDHCTLAKPVEERCAWIWSDKHMQSLENVKQISSSQHVLKFFDIESDHKLLVSITKKALVSSSPRLQRLLLRPHHLCSWQVHVCS